MNKQPPRIMRSDLTTPPRWFVVTRYQTKQGVDVDTQRPFDYIVATEKFDVTDQMRAILKSSETR